MTAFNRAIEDYDLVFFDLETTGLYAANGDAICEIGAFKMRDREIIETFHSLVNPQKPIPKEAYLVHGISEEEVKQAPVFSKITDEFIEFVQDSVLCAYNASFDMSFIDAELKKMHKQPLSIPIIDVLLMARTSFKSKKYNLSVIAQVLGIDCSKKMHRALTDVSVTSQVFFKAVDALKAKEINNLDDYICLFGFENQVYKDVLKERERQLKGIIRKETIVSIRHLDYGNITNTNEVQLLDILYDGSYPYVLCKQDQGQKVRIKLSRILAVTPVIPSS